MLRKRIAQRDRGALVEQDAHLGRSQGARLCMLQDGARLFQCDAWEPLNELGHQSAVFEVLEQCCHRHSGTSKYPRSANAVRVALDGGAG